MNIHENIVNMIIEQENVLMQLEAALKQLLDTQQGYGYTAQKLKRTKEHMQNTISQLKSLANKE